MHIRPVPVGCLITLIPALFGLAAPLQFWVAWRIAHSERSEEEIGASAADFIWLGIGSMLIALLGLVALIIMQRRYRGRRSATGWTTW